MHDSFGETPRSLVAGSYGQSALSFVRSSQLSSKAAARCCVPTGRAWGFLWLPVLTSTGCCRRLAFGPSTRWVVVTHFFNLHFPATSDVEHLSVRLFASSCL